MKHTLTLLIFLSLFVTCHAQHASKITGLQTRVVGSAVSGGEGDESEDWPPERRVFAHHVPWHPPSHARPDRTADAGPGLESQIVHAAAAGIDGFAVDVVRRPQGQMAGMLVDMAAIAQRRAPGFAIMPCLDCASIQKVDDWEAFLGEWLGRAGEMAATHRVNGAAVIFTYGAFEMPPADWGELRERLRNAGHSLFLIGEMNGLYRTQKNPLPRIREYADVFDGLYFFAPNTEEHERKLLGIERSDGRPLLRVFSPSPGYWRVNTGSFARLFQGTRTYQSQWDLACDSESWFEPSGSFCPANSPLTVELWVRPERPGGTLWGDVGVAMQLSMTTGGKPVARRRQSSDEKRIAAQGEEPLENGRWSHLAGVFDGRSLKLYRNGDLVAQAPCKGASGSSRMAIGRNPYDMTSIFTGLIDDVRVTARALKPSEFGPVNPDEQRPAPPALIK